MSKIFIVFCFFNTLLINAQSIRIVDSLTGEALGFSTISYSNGGTYSDADGFFNLDRIIADKITIYHLGYNDFIFNPSTDQFKMIKMSPKRTALDEITLTNLNKKFLINFLKTSRNIGKFPISYNNELIINLVPSNTNANSVIESVSFMLKKDRKKPTSIVGLIRLNIYNSDLEQIYESKPIAISNNVDEIIDFDLSQSYIKFKEEGISFGLEVISLKTKPNLSPIIESHTDTFKIALTDDDTKDYSATTSLRYIFSNNKEMIDLNDILSKTSLNHSSKRNMLISLQILRNQTATNSSRNAIGE